jgi:aminoglycoside 6'-N-acetyltransferase
MITQFVNATWQTATAPACIAVPVQAWNCASCCVLERSGLVPVARVDMTPDNPVDDREHVIYQLRRHLAQ